MIMNKRTQALQINAKTREIVRERDKWCVCCGSPYRLEIAHFISRGSGGLGIPENLILLCRECHREYDQSGKREKYRNYLRIYLKTQYSNWDETKLKYKKGESK